MNNDHLDGKFERLYEALGEIRAELVAIKIDLEAHMSRSDYLERIVLHLQTETRETDKSVNQMRGFFTVFGYMIAAAATILTILNQLGIL
jgi:hypothetical protein